MARRWHAIAPCLLATLGCAGAEPTWQQPTTTNAPRKDVLVQISDDSVRPSVARVLAGGSVAWLDASSLYWGAVLFPESIAKAFTCTELRPMLSQVAGGYQSLPIRGDNENVALPCPLAPGTYEYQVLLFDDAVGDGMGPDDPQLTLRASIVVE